MTSIGTDKLEFSDILDQVEQRDQPAKVPACIRKLTKKKERKHGEEYRCCRRGYSDGGGGHNENGDGGEKTRR